MNQDTLWLQVPSAKIQPLSLLKYSNIPDKLERIAIKLTSLQNREELYLDKINMVLFIADQGIVNHDANSLTQPVTDGFINKFSPGGDASQIIHEKFNAKIEVINLGTKINFNSIEGVKHSELATSTANFCHAPAMNNEQLARAINIGRQSAQRAYINGAQLFIASEINTANPLSALAMTCALLNTLPEQLSDIDSEKCKILHHALKQHNMQLTSPLEILRHLGSFEIAALTGGYLCSAHIGMPVLIDGFTSAVAALITEKLCPGAERWFLYSHTSNNSAHKLILETIGAQSLLQINQSLNDIAGIAASLSLLHLANSNHNEIINFSKESLLKRYS